MMLKIEWATRPIGSRSYHVWQMDEYFVEDVQNTSPSQVRVILDSSRHDILMTAGDIAYVMNDDGKTVEIIRPS